MIGRVLYRIFRRRILKYYYSEQSKVKGFDKMEKSFVDSNGKQYYRCVRDLDMPIKRFKECQQLLRLISSGISEENIRLITQAMRKAINEGRKPNIAEIGFLIGEIDKRNGVYVDPDMLFECAAIMYIREDENPIEIDPAIQKQKVEQLKIDSQGGLYDFFTSAGLSDYIPFVGTTENEFTEYLKESEVKMKALNIHLQKYITEPELS